MSRILEEADCSAVEALRVTAGYLVALLMATADTKEEALDGWAALTNDARRAIVMRFGEVAEMKPRLRN